MTPRTTGLLVFALLACGDSRECPYLASSGEPSGALAWQQAFAATESDVGLGIAVDGCDGRVAVGGSVMPREINATSDIWIGAVSHVGKPLWDTRIHDLFSESAGALAFADDGALVVSGVSGVDIDAGWLARFEPNGGEAWRTRLAMGQVERDASYRFSAVAVASDGRIFVAGERESYSRSDALAVAYAPTGEMLWKFVRDEYPESKSLYAVSVLEGGDVMFVGRRVGPADAEVSVLMRRFSADGELLGERLVPEEGRQIGGAAFAPTSLVLCGREWLGELRFDGVWVRETALADWPRDLALGLDGDVYLAGSRAIGSTTSAPWVARLDGTLAPVWEFIHEQAGYATDVAVGPSGDAFVTGFVEAPPLGEAGLRNQDIWIARLSR